MTQFQRILIGMDLSDMDNILLRFIDFWTGQWAQPPELHLVHNIKYPLDEDLAALLDAPLDEVIEEALHQKVKALLGAQKAAHVHVHILQESATLDALQEAVDRYAIDLTVIGKKHDLEGTGIVNSKLLRHTSVPLLLVPDTVKKQWDKVLVPIDFSEAAAHAVRLALAMQEEEGKSIALQHIYRIPQIYFPYVPVQSMRKTMLQKAKAAYHTFAKKHGLPKELQCHFTDAADNSVVEALKAAMETWQTDMIVMGRQGHSKWLGSVAIGMSRLPIRQPILMVP